jgi:SAM-dependent methyltransferase
VKWRRAWWALTALFVLNALRMRGHAAHLRALPPEAGPPAEPAAPAEAGENGPRVWRWATAAGVDVPAPVRRRVERYAEAEGLDVLDVVPRDLPAEQALQLAGADDPATYRDKWLAPALTAFQAVLVDERTWARACGDLPATDGLDPVAMYRLTRDLRRHAATTSDIVVVPGIRSAGEDLARRRATWRERFGPAAVAVLWFPAVRLTLLVVGVISFPLAGGVAAVAWCLQPLLALAGTPLRPRDLVPAVLFRWLTAPLSFVRGVAGRWRPPGGPEVDAEALRPGYEALLAGGTAAFFEARRADCPLCGSADLAVHVRAVDLVQRKPGRFVMERCSGCGHIFQNPRLSLAGLAFYYRDCYDGLGGELSELLLRMTEPAYQARAAMLDEEPPPRRWIDIGTGHGHFCLMAKRRWPDTRFDGLDISASIEVAERRGWVTRGYRGLLQDLAPELAGRYDVVSMYHYLEHTREPLAELDAAISLLATGGQLVIELPDPESPWGRLLRRYWSPWFQPQHQHMMPRPLLEAALRERGVEVVKHDDGSAEHPLNLTAALLLLVVRIAPPPGLPWRPRDAVLGRARFAVTVLLAAPFAPLTLLLDRLLPLALGPRWRSNAYRVLARRAA